MNLKPLYSIQILTFLLCVTLSGTAEAKNQTSLWTKVVGVFSSSPASTPRQNRRTEVFAAPTLPAETPPGVDPFLFEIRRRAEILSRMGLSYQFGSANPEQGGMDCSGTMMHLLKGMGFTSVPRTSYEQYQWLKDNGSLRSRFWGDGQKAYQNLRPGDLVFWGGTYNSGHKVSHVMLYLGRTQDGRHFMFGARGKKSRGVNGSGVDIFEMKPGSHGDLVGYGSVPGLHG